MADFEITRRTSIAAPPATVHALVNDFHEWVRWSPWEGLDPNLERVYSGEPAGQGARYGWNGNKQAGAGSMEIVGSTPEAIDVALRFTKPFKAENAVRIGFTPTATGTDVAWTMSGRQGAIGALFFKVMKMSDKLAADFDKGLAALKEQAERSGNA